ncbi:MAG: hypothetical protein E7305_11125 [Butyrivibrio sp.]|nr:hypothetical protein [Butyrivibrio sp.]
MAVRIKKIHPNRIIALVLWLCAALILLMSQEFVTDSLFMSALVFVSGGILFFTRTDSFLVRFIHAEKKKRQWWIFVLSLYFLIALSWHRMFENPLWDVYLELGIARKIFVYSFLFVMIPVGIVVSMCEILDFVIGIAACTHTTTGNGKSNVAGPFVALAVISFVFILAAYPGLSEPDGWGIWDWAHTGVYDEWHTIGYLLFVKVCSFIWNSLFCVEVAHVLFYLLVSFYALKILSEFYTAKGLWMYVVFTLLFFSPLMHLQGMNKDTMFVISLFGACVSIYMLMFRDKVRVTDVVFAVVFFLGTSIFRHAGFMICLVSLVVLLVYFFVVKRMDRTRITALIIGTSTLGYFLIVVLLGRWTLHAIPNPDYIKYTVPMYMMGAMAADEDVELTDEQIAAYELFSPVENWRAEHTRYNADPVSRDWGVIVSDPTPVPESVYGPAFIKTNFQLLVSHPVKYIGNFADITSILWEITRPQDSIESDLVQAFLRPGEYEEFTESVKENGFTTLIKAFTDFSADLPIYRSIVWRGGLSQFCYIVLICLAIRNKKGNLVIVASPVLLYYLSLYLSIPTQATRYVIGLSEILPFFAGICLWRCKNVEGN